MTTQRATVHTFTPGSFHSEFPALSYAARSGAKRNFSSEILPSATLACTADVLLLGKDKDSLVKLTTCYLCAILEKNDPFNYKY